MPAEIIALIDKPWLLLAVLAAGAACGMLVERIAERANRAKRRAYWEKRQGRRGDVLSSAKGRYGAQIAALAAGKDDRSFTSDATMQLGKVIEAPFKARPLLNKPEQRLLAGLDHVIAEDAPAQWRAMAQVSLGEIVSSPDKDAFLAVNSKRVDLLVIDGNCAPLFAIEYQGDGHHQGLAAARDAVKKEALRRAGIDYEEIKSGDTMAELRAIIRKQVRKRASKGAV